MAHELDLTTGRPAIAYTGEKPWHGFGESMPDNQTLDQWRVAAGLDWNVIRRPVQYSPYLEGERSQLKRNFKGREVLLRDDNFAELSVVSDRYKVVQPEAVLEFFKQLIERQGFKMSTAGSLKGGKRIWAMADCAESFSINGDKVGAHLLLATSYDGTFSTTAQFTSIRTVCNNTLQFALDRRGSEGGIVKIPHNQDFNAWDIQAELGLDASWMNFRNNVTALADHKVTKRQAIEYFLTVCGVTEEEAANGKQLFNVKKLISIYESGPGAQLPSAKDTAWGLVNAVTYMADHGRRAKDNGTRFDSASFGSGAAMKRTAFKEAIELVQAA